jgi:hypothetical protein
VLVIILPYRPGEVDEFDTTYDPDTTLLPENTFGIFNEYALPHSAERLKDNSTL